MSFSEMQFLITAAMLLPMIAGMSWLLVKGGGFAREASAATLRGPETQESWVQESLPGSTANAS